MIGPDIKENESIINFNNFIKNQIKTEFKDLLHYLEDIKCEGIFEDLLKYGVDHVDKLQRCKILK